MHHIHQFKCPDNWTWNIFQSRGLFVLEFLIKILPYLLIVLSQTEIIEVSPGLRVSTLI